LLENLRQRSQDGVGKLREYQLCFGWTGVGRCAMTVAAPGRAERPVPVSVPGSSVSVLVRPGTTDIAVFNTTFKTEQYGFELPSSPTVIVDAGAYTGLSSVYFALRYPGARVIALEPSRENYDLLCRNTADLPNVTAVQAALWINNDRLVLDDPNLGAWAFRIKQPELLADPSCATVRAMTVADISREFAPDGISLLKLDIEGSELDLFMAPHDWLSGVGAIFAELHDRFRPGCTRAFFRAVDDFPIEAWRGEAVMVARASG
jgi:FkbM family methyltransferase